MIEATAQENKPPLHSYPKLMKAAATGTIVLFSTHGEGTVVHSGSHTQIGTYSDDWLMAGFENFLGAVTLQSKPE
jgi:hypothetical protein